jgi:Superinfection immunity protein
MTTLLTALADLLIAAAIIAAYWLPTIIAARRHTTRLAQIAIINGLAGWTFIGWIIALAMAFDPATTPRQETPA